MLRRAALWGLLAVLLLVCERWLTSCLGTGSCLGTLAGPRDWVSLAMNGVTFLAVTSALAWTLRIVWLMISTSRDLRPLRHSAPPLALGGLASGLRIRRLHFLDTDLPVAFCAGFLSPAVYVSRGLFGRLGGDEIKATCSTRWTTPGLLSHCAGPRGGPQPRLPSSSLCWTGLGPDTSSDRSCKLTAGPLSRWAPKSSRAHFGRLDRFRSQAGWLRLRAPWNCASRSCSVIRCQSGCLRLRCSPHLRLAPCSHLR